MYTSLWNFHELKEKMFIKLLPVLNSAIRNFRESVLYMSCIAYLPQYEISISKGQSVCVVVLPYMRLPI